MSWLKLKLWFDKNYICSNVYKVPHNQPKTVICLLTHVFSLYRHSRSLSIDENNFSKRPTSSKKQLHTGSRGRLRWIRQGPVWAAYTKFVVKYEPWVAATVGTQLHLTYRCVLWEGEGLSDSPSVNSSVRHHKAKATVAPTDLLTHRYLSAVMAQQIRICRTQHFLSHIHFSIPEIPEETHKEVHYHKSNNG